MKKDIAKVVGASVIGIILIGLFVGQTSIEFRKFFGVQQADVERTIFEESQSYVHGKKQEASRLYLQYQRADSERERAIIRNVVPHQFANFDESRHLDGEVREFIENAKAGR